MSGVHTTEYIRELEAERDRLREELEIEKQRRADDNISRSYLREINAELLAALRECEFAVSRQDLRDRILALIAKAQEQGEK